MGKHVWRKISDRERLSLVKRRYDNDEDVAVLAREIGMKESTLDRRLREVRVIYEGLDLADVSESTGRELPDNQEMFSILKKGPISLRALSTKLDRSEETVLALLQQMKDAGYVIESTYGKVEVNTQKLPKIEYTPAKTLADEQGHDIIFGVISDTHSGSTHAQPSALNKFIDIAYSEGVRHMFHGGDLTAGMFGYRGQNYDLIPDARPTNRATGWQATENQIAIADTYMPQKDGLTYYILGGNHDYWHIANAGIDAVARYCRRREDSIFLGYDVNEVPLTENASIRLWHPTGGIPYAKSYRLQKGLEELAFQELTRAVEQMDSPKVRILLAGHLHVEIKMQSGPLHAALIGCFEGSTNYLKKKALTPVIGGAIWRVRLTENGLIQRVDYTFIPFTEIVEDWKNWPVPSDTEPIDEAETVETIFQLIKEPV